MMRLASLWPLGPCGNTATDEMIVVVVRKRAAANLPGIPAKNRARNALRNCTGAMLALMLLSPQNQGPWSMHRAFCDFG